MNALTEKRYNFAIRYINLGGHETKTMSDARGFPDAQTADRSCKLERITLVRARAFVISSHIYEERPYVTR
jgi:hypothetical protein